MGLETNVSTIHDLDADWPLDSDPRAQGAAHIRTIKAAVQNTFPNISKAVAVSDARLSAITDLFNDDASFSRNPAVPGMAITGDKTTNRQIYFSTSLSPRWSVGIDANGSGEGDTWNVYRFDSNGNFLNAPFYITRSTGAATFNNGLTVNGTCLVPAVTDWGAGQALPANQAETRYVRNNGGFGGGIAALALASDGSGRLTYQAPGGAWNQVQLSGDYATNSGLATAQAAANAAQSSANSANSGVSTLNDQKLNTVDGVATRMTINYGSSRAQFQGDGNFCLYSGSDTFFQVSTSSIAWNGQGFAFSSDLPIAANMRVEAWTQTVSYGDWVNYPTSFSGNAQSISYISTMDGGRPVLASYGNETASGFNFYPRRVDQNGSSNADSGITYKFSAIGP